MLVFDGECGFCRYWVRYWEHLTGERVRYLAYQQADIDFATVGPAEFARAIHLFEPGGRVSRGAEAAFRVVATVPGHGLALWCYRHVPVCARLSETAYAFVAAHRIGAARVARWLWGAEHHPAHHVFVSWLFLRGLGAIYLAAFASFAIQATGLVGTHGIVPLIDFLDAARAYFGSSASAWWHVPTVFWLRADDLALRLACGAGAALAVLLTLGVGQRIALVLLWALYLSLFYAGQTFMTFQWDLLLLEAGFLAIWLPGPGSALLVGLFRWLLFRFMFLSGWVKLMSGDPTWRSFTALEYHFETQPLPTVLAWYAHHLPDAVLRAGVAATFAIELVLPFFMFLPRRPRLVAATGTLLIELLILLTGNYNFFNLLTMLLCLFLFDDRAFARLEPRAFTARSDRGAGTAGTARRGAVLALALLVLPASAGRFGEAVSGARAPAWLGSLTGWMEPLHLSSVYGVFAIMTTERHEIIIEGSDDRRTWRAYGFPYKPGDVMRMPRWNVPHQPRLDWQMWFAALADESRSPWFERLLVHLLSGTPQVLALLAHNPFPDKPPRYIRASFYLYHFSTPDERRTTGAWWTRELEGSFYPTISLQARPGPTP
ncbi:MAG: lipase maturation factor family protein [Gammaproteobacteria bacterium]|nr:lipase maturation factor family protein [Gammaproteobacteria bacterium]